MPIFRPKVIIARTLKPYPQKHEIEIAEIVMAHFRQNVYFLEANKGYKIKTPDIAMGGLEWEIKSPTGHSERTTVQRQFRGLKQSRNLIIDCRRTRLSDELIMKQIRSEINNHKRVGHIIVITKTAKVVEIQ